METIEKYKLKRRRSDITRHFKADSQTRISFEALSYKKN